MASSIIFRKEGKGYYGEVNNVKTLHLKGTSYEVGFQHGALMAFEISNFFFYAIDATAAVIAKTINVSFDEAKNLMLLGQKTAQPYIPPNYIDEMRGIVDGMSSKDIFLALDQIVLLNTMYDQWCLYAHPYYSHHEKSDFPKKDFPDGIPGSHVLVTAGCSSFSAWGNAVKGDQLIFGKNMDNLNIPGVLDNRLLVFLDPAEGYGYGCAFTTLPGMVGIDGGLNTAGISMMTQYDAFIDETMKGCGIGISTRELLANAGTLDKAVSVLEVLPHCTGIAFHVADSNNDSAAIVNTSATKVKVRSSNNNAPFLFTSNHTNCYPGWYGYEGYNMVDDQKLVYTLKDVSTINNWQASLRDPNNVWVPAPSRFERYEQLINEYFGEITPQNAQTILSDRYDPYTQQTRAKDEPSTSNNILATICALYKDDTFYEDDSTKSFKAHVANLWSMVMTPKNGDFWIAINDFPAQYGGYVYFNLDQELQKYND